MKRLFKIIALVFLVAMTISACKKSEQHSLAALQGDHVLSGTEEDRYNELEMDTITHSGYEVQIDSISNISEEISIEVISDNTIVLLSSYNDAIHINSSISIPNSICFTGEYTTHPFVYNSVADTIIYNYSTNGITLNEQFIPNSPYGSPPIINYRLHTQ